MKIPAVGAELFHSDEQTDRHNDTNSRFSQFCEKPNKISCLHNNVVRTRIWYFNNL